MSVGVIGFSLMCTINRISENKNKERYKKRLRVENNVAPNNNKINMKTEKNFLPCNTLIDK